MKPGTATAGLVALGLLFSIFCAPSAGAADMAFPGGTITFTQWGPHPLTNPVKLILILTALSFAPAVLIATTSFTRIIIVLAMLRQAIGMPNTPPNPVLISLALFLTLFTMSPVLSSVDEVSVQPYLAQKFDERQALAAAEVPVRKFLMAQTRESDIALILELSGKPLPNSADKIEFFSLVPAFMLSELRTAFEIGFVIFLPFVLIDLVVASVLMSLGMIMVPPLALSLPLKVLMFILIDGWSLVTASLVKSFHS